MLDRHLGEDLVNRRSWSGSRDGHILPRRSPHSSCEASTCR